MADEFTPHDRVILSKLLSSTQNQISANQLILELQRKKEKYSSTAIEKLLSEFAKNDKIAEKAFKLCCQEKEIVSAVEHLKNFLNAYDDHRQSRRVSDKPKIGTIKENEENVQKLLVNGKQFS